MGKLTRKFSYRAATPNDVKAITNLFNLSKMHYIGENFVSKNEIYSQLTKLNYKLEKLTCVVETSNKQLIGFILIDDVSNIPVHPCKLIESFKNLSLIHILLEYLYAVTLQLDCF